MSILSSPQTNPPLAEPLWTAAPEFPHLPVDELHIWRSRMDEPRPDCETDSCPVSRDRMKKMATALFRRDVLGRYTVAPSARLAAGPASGLRLTIAHCDHVALIAVSRNVREVGLDLERVRHDLPIEEMAGGFLDARSQWDLRITWSPQEKAWKFFQFWTSNEACAQARPSSRTSCLGFSPEADFIAALAIQGGPEARVVYWDWQC